MVKRKYQPISIHQTSHGKLEVNWQHEYNDEFSCPYCEVGKFRSIRRSQGSVCKIVLHCNHCKKRTFLTNSVPGYIHKYLPNIECPNPLCYKLGHDGQKGWIYKLGSKLNHCQCRFCKITFKSDSTYHNSWINIEKDKLAPFCFDDDNWDLRHYFDKPYQKTLNFDGFHILWYRREVKRYIYHLLKSKVFNSDSSIRMKCFTLKQFGRVIKNCNFKNKSDINRKAVLSFLDDCKSNKSITINQKLANLRDFLEWLDLEVTDLIRSRDFPKVSQNDAVWLDEVTRQAIEHKLDKIPANIARHYIIQKYIAARPGDVCHLCFDCLIEENSKWYIKFFQQKSQRWHQILANREIRKEIEEQQHWIRDTFGENYSYLFCQFRNLQPTDYPYFSNIKPLPKPPNVDADKNPMVRIIRILIERENIRDINGQKPHFTGKITRSSRLQEVRTKYGMEAARLYADHQSSRTTFVHYAPPTTEQVASVDLPFQELLMNPENKFLPWQSLPESLLKNPKSHELDLEIAPRLIVYGHCALDPKIPCPINLFPKCYGCSSFRPSTSKLPLYERQYQGEQKRLAEAEKAGASLAFEEAKATIEAMDKWLSELRSLANE
ncbi:hypothetical protein NIES267_55570 [Calothrix parasitica NIES-267]|uniref:Uncharacterized protein n=1 Tax=Calothrix parasitica NIES-267 TaxID=1973488 RepID=A0A1Z4LY24_9CYAN|nr:hypothetical protein NIES267_55570 [Calothrix parasitica NIES-267]